MQNETIHKSNNFLQNYYSRNWFPRNQGNNNLHQFHQMKYRFNRKRNFCCANCGKEGHLYKECKEPITSFGIIAIRNPNGNKNFKSGLITKNYVDKFRCKRHEKNIPDCIPDPEDNPEILYLLIQRKDTMGYIDFIRGKYPEFNNIEKMQVLKTYLQEMTCEERQRLVQHDFDTLWDMIWMNKNSRLYINEYIEAKEKFAKLHIPQLIQATECCWTEQEYGFPKGRKNMQETNIQCARREFEEETGYTQPEIRIISDKQWEEIFTGTNNVTYRHVYFIAEVPSTVTLPKIDLVDIQQEGEISNLGWFTFEQCMKIIRPYDKAKKELLTRIHEKYKNRYV